MARRSIVLFVAIGLLIIQLYTTGVKAAYLDPDQTVTQRVHAAEVIESYDDLYYDGHWEVRENFVYTVLYYQNGFTYTTSQADVTTQADANAGLTRLRTYYHYTTT